MRAFAEVQKQFPEARLDLVGKGPCEDDIRALVRDLNVRNVHFAGVASREQIGHFYDQADIFVNASHLDNMPVSIIEAYGAGTPVVDRGGREGRRLPAEGQHRRHPQGAARAATGGPGGDRREPHHESP